MNVVDMNRCSELLRDAFKNNGHRHFPGLRAGSEAAEMGYVEIIAVPCSTAFRAMSCPHAPPLTATSSVADSCGPKSASPGYRSTAI
jgi:hypothetical protein